MNRRSIRGTDVCPFCGRDPYDYVDIGVGHERVGVTCCNMGIAAFDWRSTSLAALRIKRLASLLVSNDPRRQRRGARLVAAEGHHFE